MSRRPDAIARALLPLALAAGLALSGCRHSAAEHLETAERLAYAGRHESALREVQLALEALRNQPEAGTRELRMDAYALGAQLTHVFLHRPREALAFYRALVDEGPDADRMVQARERMARILIDDLGDAAGGVAQHQALVLAFPERPGVDRYQYEAARGYLQLGDHQQVRTEVRMLLERWPESEWADDARFLAGTAWQAQGRLDKAVEAFHELVDHHPGSELASRALVQIGECHAELGHEAEALEAWVAALDGHPDPQFVQMKMDRFRARVRSRRPSTEVTRSW